MAFILATPHCSAFLSAGDPVTREPMSSLSSVRYWKACESIIASPAIFTSAGFVPSSSGPFGAGRLSARAIPAPPQENPSATTATLAKIRRICLLPHAFRAQETLSRSRDAPAEERFRSSAAAGCRFCTRKPVEGCTPVTTAQPGFPFTFTRPRPHPTLPFVTTPSLSGPFPCLRISSLLLLLALVCVSPAQEPAQKPVEKRADKKAEKTAPPEKTENPAHIELLETRCRFEASGDSRKEVHARVHINSELGVRQFARLNFDYNRAFQSIDIPLVRITHPSGGTADILPSAITDNPNPAVVNAPVYQDVRVKSVRILGLEPGDNLEYRVITTTSHHPLAPDFWLDHSFDRSGVVFHEIFEFDLPASRKPEIRINPATPAVSTDKLGEGDA